MRSLYKALLLGAPAAVVALALGCGGNTPSTTPSDDSTTNPPEKKDLTELTSTGWGTLKGKVTLDGAPPAGLDDQTKSLQDLMKGSSDKDVCLMGTDTEKEQQQWRIHGNAVQNVVVFLRPTKGHYFKIDPANPTWSNEVKVEQPHCAFIPHVVTLFPSYYDPKSTEKGHLKPTGQTFLVVNNAPMTHNTDLDGGTENPKTNQILPKGAELKPQLKPTYIQPVQLSCQIHKWMNGYAWVFNHPYAAVTNDKGEYEIKQVPTGAELEVVAWHEKANWINGGPDGQKKTLKDGENPMDFTVKAPSK